MDNPSHIPSKKSGRAIAGLILTAIGLMLLFQQFDWFFFPSWLFSWPMILIIVGLIRMGNNRSNSSSWLVLVVVGCLFLLEKIIPGAHVLNLGWPAVIIAIGLWMILRHRRETYPKETFSKEAYADNDFLNPDPSKAGPSNSARSNASGSNEDYLSSFCIFGDVKKNVLSKTFKGGEVVNVFGATSLDFSHADLSSQVVLDVMQLFGGTKLIVPPHWHVISDVAAIFGGVNDKRVPHADAVTSGKVLWIKGASVFGGIDIKSF